MPVLTLDDLATYAPGISQSIDEAYLTGLIARVQAYAESPLGADRPLEVTVFNERLTVVLDSYSSSFYLRHAPVLATPAPVLERRVGLEWTPFTSDQFTVEVDGLVEMSDLIAVGAFVIPIDRSFPSLRLRASYSSGFDFTSTDNEIIAIKSLLGVLAQMLFNADGGSQGLDPSKADRQGIAEYSVQGGEKVVYASQKFSQSAISLASDEKLDKAIKTLLLPLKKYAPTQINAS